MRHIAWAVRVLLAGILAFAAGAGSIWWLGDSWWSVLGAVLTAITVYLALLGTGKVVPDGSP
jgi:hypothetical protein